MTSPGQRGRLSALFEPVGRLSLQREIVMTLLILAESMVVYIYGGTLLAERDEPFTPLPALLIFATLLIAYQIPHLLETIRIWSPEYEAIMAFGLLGILLLVIKTGAFPDAPLFATRWIEDTVQALILRENESIRPVWPLIVLVVYAWTRGRTRAEPVLETGYSMLRFGMIWVAAGLLLSLLTMPSSAETFERMTPAVAGFLVFSLLAIAVSRHQPSRVAPGSRSIWIWGVVVVLPILVIAMSTISVAGILTRETLDLVFTVLSPVFWTIGLMIQVAVLIIAVLAFIVLSPVIWFLERQGIASLSGFPSIDIATGRPGDLDDLAQSTLALADPIRYVIAGTVLILLGWALIRFAFRRRRGWSEQHRQQRESLIEWQAIPIGLLQRTKRWLQRGVPTARTDPFPSDPIWDGNRRIRRTYRAFLRVNERERLPRDPGETPTGFARRVAGEFQELHPEIDQITGSYNLARYSGKPVDREVATRAERAQDRFERECHSLPFA